MAIKEVVVGKSGFLLYKMDPNKKNITDFTVSAVQINGYKNLTVENFILEIVKVYYVGNGKYLYTTPSKSYNSSDGVLTVSGLYGAQNYTDGGGIIVNVWVIETI